MRLRYEAEKALYSADRMNERLMIRPDLVTESQSDSLIERYVTTLRDALIVSIVARWWNEPRLNRVKPRFRFVQLKPATDFLKYRARLRAEIFVSHMQVSVWTERQRTSPEIGRDAGQ